MQGNSARVRDVMANAKLNKIIIYNNLPVSFKTKNGTLCSWEDIQTDEKRDADESKYCGPTLTVWNMS